MDLPFRALHVSLISWCFHTQRRVKEAEQLAETRAEAAGVAEQLDEELADMKDTVLRIQAKLTEKTEELRLSKVSSSVPSGAQGVCGYWRPELGVHRLAPWLSHALIDSVLQTEVEMLHRQLADRVELARLSVTLSPPQRSVNEAEVEGSRGTPTNIAPTVDVAAAAVAAAAESSHADRLIALQEEELRSLKDR